MGHMTNLSTQIHSSIPQYDIYKVSLKKIVWKVPFGCVKVDIFAGPGSKSGLTSGILVGFGVVITLQVNANDTFGT